MLYIFLFDNLKHEVTQALYIPVKDTYSKTTTCQ